MYEETALGVHTVKSSFTSEGISSCFDQTDGKDSMLNYRRENYNIKREDIW